MSYLKNEDLPNLLKERKPVFEPDWFTDQHRYHLVMLKTQDGLLKRRHDKLSEADKTSLFELEAADFLMWENDKMGRKNLLTLTWKGDDLAIKLRSKLK